MYVDIPRLLTVYRGKRRYLHRAPIELIDRKTVEATRARLTDKTDIEQFDLLLKQLPKPEKEEAEKQPKKQKK
jgi:hypothetical protein